jgi:DNA-binding transcriptional LysR family regulator
MISDLDRFELFTYVAQYGSLTQAAEALHMSKASLSKQIKHLEVDLKVDLFTRSTYRLQLTEAGTILLAQCLRLKKELDDARAVCQQLVDEPQGILKIVAFEYFARQLIFPKLPNFLTAYPKLELNIFISERIPDFEQEQIDLAVGFSLPAGDEIVRRSMMTTRYVLCASPSYFKKMGKPDDLIGLQQHLYIGHSSRAADSTINLKPPHHLVLKPFLLLNSVFSMIECAKQGIGIVQLPLYLLESALKKGELVEILPDLQAEKAHVYYYYPRYRYVQPKVRKFIDFFLE